jgi:nucleoside-diphosphate-sugar epimerase
MAPLLQSAGHEVTGLDTNLFANSIFSPPPANYPTLAVDLRDVQPAHLAGFDAVIHLAALSNDPLGSLDAELTYDINHRASVRLAKLAREAGVRRFLYSSSCSVYGSAGEDFVTEEAPLAPVTPYGESKVWVEAELREMADASFCPVFLRNATAYGMSPCLRSDLVLNDFVGAAVTSGTIVVKSDGSALRPLVHIGDISGAFLATLEAPEDAVRGEAFNVGRTDENFTVRELAELVRAGVPGSTVSIGTGGKDTRSYRVSFEKIRRMVPGFTPKWTVAAGIEELRAAYVAGGTTPEDLNTRFIRLHELKRRQEAGALDATLRPRELAVI